MANAGRAAVPLAAAVLGFLAVLAAGHREAPARGARRIEIVDLIQEQDERVRTLRAEVARLRSQLEGLGPSATPRIRDLRARVGRLALRAGTRGVTGPGVVVTLDDSPAPRSPTGDPNDLLIHERDIQTVVNALWAAGAEAVAINDERLTTLSAVRCAGNTLLLHGNLHAPPYQVAAIGDPDRLAASLDSQPGIARLGEAARTFGLGYAVRRGPVSIPSRAPGQSLSLAEPA
ncbi:MAG TPA: DUF881 domain-containing protein [Actinomycetota bacterium]|nr:DUF881 domain-containing protein [Actinomycetota bacterium]